MKYLVMLSVCMISGCLLDPVQDEVSPAGSYHVTAYKEDGSIEAQGWISFTVGADSVITGTWKMSGLDGDGTLVGRQSGDLITLDLHPQWRDHNFVMRGTCVGDMFTGSWEFLGIAGPMMSGTFTGKK